jgi:predicted membrane protein
MIGDIFIGLLLIFSAAINLLAIGSFWVTPSLRTTTNRFVANLLIVNFLSCLVLSPAAFSPAITSSSNAVSNDNNINVNKSQSLEHNNINASMLIINNNNVSSSQTSTIQFDGDVMSVERIENIMERYQSCSLDFVVAVSVLSMLLVVMDTFIAVTDPLRYHSRISDLKAWILIGLCWIIGISVGIASALQSSAKIISNENISSGGCVYNTMFLLTYFLSIILTPFLLVILMYWRIFTEARESGQRMRQNGSSPLLQSALNLATSATSGHQQNSQSQHNPLPSPQCLLLVTSPSLISCKQQQQSQQHLQQSALNKQKTSDNNILSSSTNTIASSKNNNIKVTTPPSTTDGLTMRIDKQDYYGVNNNLNQHDNYHQLPFSSETKTFLLSSPPHELMPILDTINETEKSLNEPTENHQLTKQSRQHQNILLTLTTACEAAATVKRNQSEKHLLTEDSSFFTSHDESKLLELRQVRSSPNLQLNTFETHEQQMIQPHETLELPQSVQASPKALRYMNSLRHRLSNASSLFKYREEGRAARISILGKF